MLPFTLWNSLVLRSYLRGPTEVGLRHTHSAKSHVLPQTQLANQATGGYIVGWRCWAHIYPRTLSKESTRSAIKLTGTALPRAEAFVSLFLSSGRAHKMS